MQSPLYPIRKQQLALIAAAARDPAAYWGRHGMLDIVDMIVGYISQIALSFCIEDSGYIILYRDIRDNGMYVTYPDGSRKFINPTSITSRVEITHSSRTGRVCLYIQYLDMWNVRALDSCGDYWYSPSLDAGVGFHIGTQLALRISDSIHEFTHVPPNAVSARFKEICATTPGWQVCAHYLNTDGQIHMEILSF